MNRPKCIMVIGPSSTGSMLIAKTIAAALGIAEWGKWNGVQWAKPRETKGHNIFHLSIPNPNKEFYEMNLDEWARILDGHDLYYILTTRDENCSNLSRVNRWNLSQEKIDSDKIITRQVINTILLSKYKSMIWSYETFMFLENDYLTELWKFLEFDSNFIPPLEDGNKKYIKGLK